MQEALYGVAMAKDLGVDVEVLGRDGDQARTGRPPNVDDLFGGVNFPTDGTVNPGDAALAFAKGAVDQRRALRARHRRDRLPDGRRAA